MHTLQNLRESADIVNILPFPTKACGRFPASRRLCSRWVPGEGGHSPPYKNRRSSWFIGGSVLSLWPRCPLWRQIFVFPGFCYSFWGKGSLVEAAKARDRKAYELAGEYAYVNFPDDFKAK